MAELLRPLNDVDASYHAGEITLEQLRAEYSRWYAARDAGEVTAETLPTVIEVIGASGAAPTKEFPLWFWIAAAGAVLYFGRDKPSSHHAR